MDIQETTQACGRAVVRESVKTFYRRTVGEYVRVDEPAGDFLSIEEALSRRGVLVSARKEMSLDEIRTHGTPAIIHLEREGRGHFVLLKGWRGKRVAVYDPAYGLLSLDWPELEHGYTGNALLLARGEKSAKERERIPSTVGWLMRFIFAFLAVVRAAMIFLAFAMVGSSETALGALLPILVLMLDIGVLAFVLASDSRRYVTQVALPGSAGDTSLYRDLISIHSSQLTSIEARCDGLTLGALTIFTFLLQSTEKALVYLLALVCFFLVELFARQLKTKLGALSSYREDQTIRSGEVGSALSSVNRYLVVTWLLHAFAFSFLAFATILFNAESFTAGVSGFLSDFFVLAGMGIVLIRLISLSGVRSQLRRALYRIPTSVLPYLNAKGHKNLYNLPRHERERKSKPTDIR